MAKDKSKKSKADDDFGAPSEAPAGGDGFKLTSDENRGRLMLITPLRSEQHEDSFKPGEKKEVIVADVVVIDEKHPERSEEHEGVWVFGGYLKGALRGYIGERKVLARLTNTEDTSKKKDRGHYVWEFVDATAKEKDLARAYMAARNDPFRKASADKPGKKGKAAPAPEPEPKKGKGKKAPEPVPAKKSKGKK